MNKKGQDFIEIVMIICAFALLILLFNYFTKTTNSKINQSQERIKVLLDESNSQNMEDIHNIKEDKPSFFNNTINFKFISIFVIFQIILLIVKKNLNKNLNKHILNYYNYRS